jgi:hypothetical protein
VRTVEGGRILLAVEFGGRCEAVRIRAADAYPDAIEARVQARVQAETMQKLIDSLGSDKDVAVAACDWKTASQGAAISL